MNANQMVNEQNSDFQPTEKTLAAFVIGGTGGVGAHLVRKLLNSPRYARVTVVSRRDLPPHPKLNAVIWDDFSEALLDHPQTAVAVFKGHDVGFCCLGASEQAMMGLFVNPKKFGPRFRTVDYDYVVGAASAAYQGGVPYFSLVSSISADPDAQFIYSSIKGEMERDVQAIGLAELDIFRPSHLVKEATGDESTAKRAWKGLLTSFTRLLPAKEENLGVEDVAEAMKVAVEQSITMGQERTVGQEAKVAFYEPDAILALAAIGSENRRTIDSHPFSTN